MEIKDKIKDALCNFCKDGSGLIIQFWSPIETSSSCQRRQVLSTVDQPFSLDPLDDDDTLRKYRLSCLDYYYCIDNNNKLHIAQEEEDHPLIISSSRNFGIPVATAFLDCSPQVIIHPRVVVGCSPLLRSAFQCGLTVFLTIPVFLNQTSSFCSAAVGVLECSLSCSFHILDLFHNLTTALESVGLNTYQIPSDKPYETIPGLKDAIDEVEAGLELVCASLDLPVAQVWIPYENKSNHTILSYTRVAGLNMMGYFKEDSDDAHMPFIKAYYVTCATLPLNMGDGLAWKTLQTYEPHFCRNVYELRVNGLLGMLYAKAKFSCFVICLRNINTGNLDYAFEFLWPRSRSYLILLESLLLTLKRGLPSFQFASGTQLDDELRVLDVENSTGSGIGSFKILEKNRLSQIPKALEEGRKSVAEDCISSSEVKFKTTSIPLPREDIRHQTGTTVSTRASKCKNNVLDISESQGSNFFKRKLSDLNQEDNIANHDHSFSSNSVRCLGDDELIIESENGAQTIRECAQLKVGLDTFDTQVSQPYKITPCLKRAMCEIEEALKIVCESHHITLAQVWIPYENDKHVPCVEEPRTKQLFAVKLTGYSVGGLSASLKEYYDTCDVLPLKIGNGLAGKALQTYELVHLCKNIYELDGLAICLRSIHTGDLDYAFEFLWPHRRYYLLMLKSLFVTLKRCLPTFKFASGAQLVDDEISSTLKRFDPSDDEAATDVRLGDASLIPDALKKTRRASSSDLHESQAAAAANQEEHAESFSSVACLGDYEVIIAASYGDQVTGFFLHISSKLVDVKKNIDDGIKLGPRSYRLEYLLKRKSKEQLWISLDNDADWKTCIKAQKLFGHQQSGYYTIEMRVLAEN